jgi:hypothetical protein
MHISPRGADLDETSRAGEDPLSAICTPWDRAGDPFFINKNPVKDFCSGDLDGVCLSVVVVQW